MYNGIGLQTPRGSGTNGYIQTNRFFVKPKTGKVAFTSNGFVGDEGTAGISKKPNLEILEHDRKRQAFLKLEVLKNQLLDEGCTDKEVEERVENAREQMNASPLLDKIGACTVADVAGTKISETQSHQIAARKEKQLERFREALKICQKTPDDEPATGVDGDGDQGNSRKSNADDSLRQREKVEHPFLDRKFSWKRSSAKDSAEEDHDHDHDQVGATKNETKTTRHKRERRRGHHDGADPRRHKHESGKKKRRVLGSDTDDSPLLSKTSKKQKIATARGDHSCSSTDPEEEKKKEKKKRKANFDDADDSTSDYSTDSEKEKKRRRKKKKRENKKHKSRHERIEMDGDCDPDLDYLQERGERKPRVEEGEAKPRKRERGEPYGEEKRSAIDELDHKRRRYARDGDDREHGGRSHGRRGGEERGGRHRDGDERMDCYSKRSRYENGS